MKSSTSFYVTLALVVVIFCISIGYTYQQTTRTPESSSVISSSSSAQTVTASVNGIYRIDQENTGPVDASIVVISSSTPESIHFVVETEFGGYAGYYSGTAYRIGTSSTYFTDIDTEANNGVCIARITFLDTSRLIYSLTEKPDSSDEGSCNSNAGVGGGFLNDMIHKKDK